MQLRKVIFILTLLLTFYGNLIGQNDLQSFLDDNFIGGSKEFNSLMFKNIKYPTAARENQITGKSTVQISISKEGTITKVNFINKLGYGIEEEVDKTIKLSNDKWKKSENERKFEITFGFKTNLNPNVEGDILTMAFVNSKPEIENNKVNLTEKETYKLAKKMMKKGEYEKAENLINQLTTVYPSSKKYKKLKSKLGNKTN